MRVTQLEPGADARWDAYVDAHPDATFFHRSGWRRVLHAALGHRTLYLVAETDARLVGALPLAHVRSILFGNTLASLPFCAYGGALADGAEVRAALESEAIRLARELGVGSLEFRNLTPGGAARPTKRLYDTFFKPLATTDEENLQAVRGKQRNVIRKGIKAGLSMRSDDLDGFFPVYAESVRNLGTPVFPRRLFAALKDEFADHTEFVSAFEGDRRVASAMLFYFRDSVCPYFWGGSERARAVAANDFLCWRIMAHAAQRGCRTFDFGRSKTGTGSYQWKVNLGFEARPLYYEYELIRDREIPNVNPLNPKYRLFIEGWKRLPLPVANLLGPWLARSLG